MFPAGVGAAAAEGLSKASSLVLRMGTDAHLYDDPDDASIPTLLDSRFDADKVEALKRLLALIAQGADVAHLFPQVVKNIASQSLEVKKLVYLYLLHYAEKRQNEALLSINCFQKDLSDVNPLVRAWALRTMAGIRLHAVAPLILAAIIKSARDPSTYVRKCAAYAIPKLYGLVQQEEAVSLEEVVNVLLSDNSPGVVGAAAVAFSYVCPNNVVLIAKRFRRLCETLPDVEEWAQIILIDILLRYTVARHSLLKNSVLFSSSESNMNPGESTSLTVDNKSSDSHVGSGVVSKTTNELNPRMLLRYYIEGDEGYLTWSDPVNKGENSFYLQIIRTGMNDDIRILLESTTPLLWSQNSGVVLAAAGVHWIMAPAEEVKRIVGPIIFSLRSSQDTAYVMLCNILLFAKAAPHLFTQFYEDFYISSVDTYEVRALKLEILSLIATESSVQSIFDEFQDYVKDPDRRFATDTVAAIGLCAQRIPKVTTACIEGLLALVIYESSVGNSSKIIEGDGVLVQAIMSIKAILKQDPSRYEDVIIRLIRILDKIKEPASRAMIIWIFGEYSSVGARIPKITQLVLKYLASSFPSEEVETKLQIINAAVKVLIHGMQEDRNMLRRIAIYIIELASYDLNYDVRDRARLISKLIVSDTTAAKQESTSCKQQDNSLREGLVQHIFGRKVPSVSNLSVNLRIYLPGSLSQIVLHAAPGYVPLPKPCSIQIDPSSLDDIPKSLNIHSRRMNDADSSEVDEDEFTGSSAYENCSQYESDGYSGSAVESRAAGDKDSAPLINISDTNINENVSSAISSDLGKLLPKSALESWLDQQPAASTTQGSEKVPYARISITSRNFECKAKLNVLLDPAVGNGLSVQYAFSTDEAFAHPPFVSVDLFFENCTSNLLSNIAITNEESSENFDPRGAEPVSLSSDALTVLPVEAIPVLAPNHKIKKLLHVHFPHHVLPLKLNVNCDGTVHHTKLRPDIGYFVQPLIMDFEAFVSKEILLRGMFEYSRSCIFKGHLLELQRNMQQSPELIDTNLIVAQSLASRIMANTNLHLVSMDMPVTFQADDVSGLRLLFSGEILSSSKPCLITLMVRGKSSQQFEVEAKVNCEDAMFGPNFLNKIVAVLEID